MSLENRIKALTEAINAHYPQVHRAALAIEELNKALAVIIEATNQGGVIEDPDDPPEEIDPPVVPPGDVIAVPVGWRHTYSELQWLSADGRYALLTNPSTGDSAIFSFPDFQLLTMVEGTAPRWIDGLESVVTHSGRTIRITHASGSYREIAGLLPITPEKDASHQDAARDGQLIGFYGEGMAVVVDLVNETIHWQKALNVSQWVGVSPLGTGLVVQSGKTKFHPFDGSTPWVIVPDQQHSDVGIDSVGREFYQTTESVMDDSGNWPQLARIYLDTRETFRFGPRLAWDEAGWVSTGARYVDGRAVLTSGYKAPNEIVLISEQGDRRVLATHSFEPGGGNSNYWHQPHAALSPDGRWVIYQDGAHGALVVAT